MPQPPIVGLSQLGTDHVETWALSEAVNAGEQLDRARCETDCWIEPAFAGTPRDVGCPLLASVGAARSAAASVRASRPATDTRTSRAALLKRRRRSAGNSATPSSESGSFLEMIGISRALNLDGRGRVFDLAEIVGSQVHARAAEILVAKLHRNERGAPQPASLTTIPARWIDGPTVRDKVNGHSESRQRAEPALA